MGSLQKKTSEKTNKRETVVKFVEWNLTHGGGEPVTEAEECEFSVKRTRIRECSLYHGQQGLEEQESGRQALGSHNRDCVHHRIIVTVATRSCMCSWVIYRQM